MTRKVWSLMICWSWSAKKRGMMMSGGVVNTERAAITVLDEFRSGKIGRISLERPHTAVQDSSQQL